MKNEEIKKTVKLLSSKFDYFKHLSDADKLKIILTLYNIQKSQESDDWIGAPPTYIRSQSGVKKYRNLARDVLKPLEPILITEGYDKFYPNRTRYKLTKYALEIFENLLKKSDDVFQTVSSQLPLNQFQTQIKTVDTIYYVLQALAVCDSYKRTHDKAITLFNLSSKMAMYPADFLYIIQNYVFLSSDTNRKKENASAFFSVDIKNAIFPSFERRCDEPIICRTLCRRCHRSLVTLTEEGENNLKVIYEHPPESTVEPLRRISSNLIFRVLIGQISILVILAIIFGNFTIDHMILSSFSIGMGLLLGLLSLISKIESKSLFIEDEE